jgi:hypothetical protein
LLKLDMSDAAPGAMGDRVSTIVAPLEGRARRRLNERRPASGNGRIGKTSRQTANTRLEGMRHHRAE